MQLVVALLMYEMFAAVVDREGSLLPSVGI
jgi:hypothetical protein